MFQNYFSAALYYDNYSKNEIHSFLLVSHVNNIPLFKWQNDLFDNWMLSKPNIFFYIGTDLSMAYFLFIFFTLFDVLIISLQLDVQIESTKVKICIRGGDVLLQGPLHKPVTSSECVWDLTPKKFVTVRNTIMFYCSLCYSFINV